MTENTVDNSGQNAIVVMRIFIGWHFLYEGVIKLFNPSWTAKGYLVSSEGFMSFFFVWLSNDSMINIVDILNVFLLVVVGLTLLLGYMERLGAMWGAALLIFYYLAHPAFPGLNQAGTEGSYWIINKNLIEAAALFVIYKFPTESYFGLSKFFRSN